MSVRRARGTQGCFGLGYTPSSHASSPSRIRKRVELALAMNIPSPKAEVAEFPALNNTDKYVFVLSDSD